MKIKAENFERGAVIVAPLLDTEGVAQVLNVAGSTVEWWRSQKQGPKFIRLGHGKRAPIRYEAQAVVEYLREMRVATEQV